MNVYIKTKNTEALKNDGKVLLYTLKLYLYDEHL